MSGLESPTRTHRRAAGVAAALPDNHYYLGLKGFVHATRSLDSRDTTRNEVVILLSADDKPFRIVTAQDAFQAQAMVVGAGVTRALQVADAGVLSFNVSPLHPAYPDLSRCFQHVKVLDRDRFRAHDNLLQRAVVGEATMVEASKLFEAVVALTPMPRHVSNGLDPRVSDVVDAINRRFQFPSADTGPLRLSAALRHLFHAEMGLSVRAYRGWRRIAFTSQLLAPEHGLTLTEIAQSAGFSDSAQLSRVWRATYGFTPSSMRSKAVRVVG